MDWERFYRYTQDSPPWPLLMQAAALLPAGGRALDLGAGAGRDTRYLLTHGFEVTAVDADTASIPRLEALQNGHLRVVHSTFEAFAFEPQTYDLISAQFSLPFVPEPAFSAVFARLKAALRPGGIFAGQFFGMHDQWNTPGRQMTFVTREQADALVGGLDVLELREEEHDGQTADGSPKHWHAFHTLARRPPA
jgi:SAM-dependent methyltransferase